MQTRKAPQRRQSTLLIALIILFLFNLIPNAKVNSAANILRVTPNGSTDANCGVSWISACDLQYSLENRVDTTNGGTWEIWIKSGTYYPSTIIDRSASFIVRSGVSLLGGFAGNENNSDDRDWLKNSTILSGDIDKNDMDDIIVGNNVYHVVTVGGSSVTIDGVTIKGGKANGMGSWDNFGAGIIDDGDGDLFLKNATITDNSAAYGAGLYNWVNSITLTNVIFYKNSAAEEGGGLMNSSGTLALSGVTFRENTAKTAGGGMMTDIGDLAPSLINVSFNNNVSNEGGGIYLYGRGDFYEQPSPIISNSVFRGNVAYDDGGGIYIRDTSPIMTNLAFINNVARSSNLNTFGGGIISLNSNMQLTNITFAGNTATFGGGIANRQGGPILSHVTFKDNLADVAGAFYNDNGSPRIQNSILWGNGLKPIGNLSDNVSNVVVKRSIVESGFPGEGNSDSDPRFGILGDYGGATLTIPLIPGSPAVDNISAVDCIQADATPLLTDQRGKSRPQGIKCDMGAYEAPPYFDNYLPTVRK